MKHVIIDWDFDTFHFDGDRLILYDDPVDEEIIVEGWTACGERMEPTKAARQIDGSYLLEKR